MRRKDFQKSITGFSLVELLIAITLFSAIATITTTIFTIALRNYQENTVKSGNQRNLNFSLDSITEAAKSASEVVTNKEEFIAGPTTLILGVPAQNQNGDFIYNGAVLGLDYYIYYINGKELHKKIYAHQAGRLASQDQSDSVILRNTSLFNVDYYPGINDVSSVNITLTASQTIRGREIAISQSRMSKLRNKQ